MVGNTLFNIAHAAVSEFDRVFVYDFVELVCWEASADFLMYGGFNQVTFLDRQIN